LIGSTSGGNAVVIVVTVVATLVVLGGLIAVASLLRTARQLRALTEELIEHTTAVLGDVEVAMSRAQGELDRVDDLVGSAQAITHTVGSASRLARLALSGPVIKIVALSAGTARAGRRLRKPGVRGDRATPTKGEEPTVVMEKRRAAGPRWGPRHRTRRPGPAPYSRSS
jgi:hypothetical protein